MKKSVANLLGLLSFIIVFWSCNSREDKDNPATAASDSSRVTVSGFLTTAYQGCISSIELAGLANKSNSLEIRNYADKVTNDDKTLLDSIILIAESKSITLPDSAKAFAAMAAKKISSKDGNDFDKALIRALAAENRRIASAFRSARKISDPTIKDFARNNKNILREQSDALRQLRKGLREPANKAEKQRGEEPA